MRDYQFLGGLNEESIFLTNDDFLGQPSSQRPPLYDYAVIRGLTTGTEDDRNAVKLENNLEHLNKNLELVNEDIVEIKRLILYQH